MDKCCHITTFLHSCNLKTEYDTLRIRAFDPVQHIRSYGCSAVEDEGGSGVVDELQIPLTFTAESTDSSIAITHYSNKMFYRNGISGSWIPYSSGTVLPLSKIGDSVQFLNEETELYKNNKAATVSGVGRIGASGNIMSLMNFREDCPPYCFRTLFTNCVALTKLPLMPATELGMQSYYHMFLGCANITEAKLPNITNPGALACRALFNGCKNLVRIEVDFTSWSDAFIIWVGNTAKSGTFVKPKELPEIYGADRIPNGWTVINKD